MNICLLVTNLAGSGAERIVITLAQAFARKNIDVTIITLEDIIHYELGDTTRVVPLTTRRTFYKKLLKLGDWLLSKKLTKKLEELEKASGTPFDCVISNLPPADKVLALTGVRNDFYVIHMNYSAELEYFRKSGKLLRSIRKKKQYRTVYKDKRLITVSNSVEKDIESLGIPCQSVRTIYNPFDFDMLRSQSISDVEGIPDYDYILHPAAFRNQKRHDVLFESIKYLKSDLKIVLLTKPFDKLKQMIKEYGVEDRVVIAGFQKNPFPFFKNAKLVVLSSEREGLPTVLIESLVLEVPIVSTDCPSGPSEILTGELAQFLCPVADSVALADRIDSALLHYPRISPDHYEKFRDTNVVNHYLEYCVGS